MKERLDQIWDSLLEMKGDLRAVAIQADVTAERLRSLDTKVDSNATELKAQIKGIVTDAAKLRADDAPALSWAKWQRTSVFWILSAAGLSAVGWAVNKWLEFLQLFGPHK